MVSRAWILLNTLPLVLLLGCPAERLGVELPRGGRDAISQEDIQRDVWMLVALAPRNRQPEVAAARVAHRLQQMHTLPAFGDNYQRETPSGGMLTCGMKDGQGDRGVVLLALDDGVGSRTGALPVASMISVAKGFDVRTHPEDSIFLCAGWGDDAFESFVAQPPMPASMISDVWILGPQGGDVLLEEVGPSVSTVSSIRLTTGRHESHGTSNDIPESMDYRSVVTVVQQIYDRVAMAPPAQGATPDH